MVMCMIIGEVGYGCGGTDSGVNVAAGKGGA
jgi:hypothetical protein